MPRIYHKTGGDVIPVTANGRFVLFTRADDEPFPYAEVSDDEAKSLIALFPGDYELAGTLPIPFEAGTGDAVGPHAEEDEPKRGRKKKAAE